ncbi:MAG TPA: hypothetical protein K8V35_06750 [Aliicoccus persicus]|uniref:Uncharacterized protein n=1 Tax=Aliicoccus persicus TaxID=930138 RepID=A0A921DY23_9STAP|nr:hypothetical protein [Aliicoccus persicus]
MKKILTISLLFTFTIVLSGCADASSESATMEEENEWMKSRITELQEENAALLEEIQALDPEFEYGNEEEPVSEASEEYTDESKGEESN